MNYPAISSNTLFHFTSKREYLIDILENNFKARYCFENLDCIFPEETREKYWSKAIPMTCFCDLPLSQTYKHLVEYGGYGIGLTKEWGKLKGLSPILYIHSNSPLKKMIKASVSSLIYNLIDDNDSMSKLADELYDVTHFIKPYEGDFLRRGSLKSDVRFYDEREWRFVPDNAITLSEIEFNDSTILNQYYTELGNSRNLEFTPNDIRYIIVESEDEVLEMYKEIKNIKSLKYSTPDVEKLQTRIISAQQIKEDF